MKSYSDYIKTGELSPLEAIKMNTLRETARKGASGLIKQQAGEGLPADASAFGMLDVIAVYLVHWFGPAGAGEVLRHYAEVCERQKPAGKANG